MTTAGADLVEVHPARCELEEILSAMAAGNGSPGRVDVFDRTPNPYESTFPTELVTCRLADGTIRTLFCKHTLATDHRVYGHRVDVAYEAAVYRNVLEHSPVRTVGLFGGLERDGRSWLVLDALVERVRESPDAAAAPAAAAWAGASHRVHEKRDLPAMLTRYDATYFRGWLNRTRRFAPTVLEDPSWLEELETSSDDLIEILLSAPQTFLHGEYYSHNIMFADGVIFPIDWESAAAGAGEIDLAMLVDGWPEDEAEPCREAYAAARWPLGAPRDHRRTLDAAAIYVHLRWLGDRPEWTRSSSYRFDDLRALGERLGLL
jgi:hypothetical protein